MGVPAGFVELDRSVESITVGTRHRTDLGDLNALAASIERDGLLQPLTITPDGHLVCGARRLAAIRTLGWRTVNVWVRSGISDRLGQLLAEQDDNALHKPLTPLEAAGLYREIKALMAEDAARRQAATRFTTKHQPDADGDGVGKFPTPSHQPKRSDVQAAAMIPGAPSYKTLDKISWLHNLAADPTQPDHRRTQAAEGLAAIDTGAAVDPIYQNLHHPNPTGEDLDALAVQALARIKTQKPGRKPPTPPSARPDAGKPPARYSWRAFWAVWGDLTDWWMHYDPAEIAARLTTEQLEQFFTTINGTLTFAQQLRTHTRTQGKQDAASSQDTTQGQDTSADASGRQAAVRLRLV